MVQIEELGKVIAQIISQRNANATRKIPEMVQSVYSSLKLDKDFLLNHSPEEIVLALNGEDMAGLQRMELAAKLLLEDSYLHPEEQQTMRQKAKEMLEYIQANDSTFSLERIQLLEEINELIKESEISK
jgi:hypothetical protein